MTQALRQVGWSTAALILAGSTAFGSTRQSVVLSGSIVSTKSRLVGNKVVASAPKRPLDPKKFEALRRPIAHKPFQFLDPRTNRLVTRDTEITLADGKKVPAGKFYDQLNDLEKYLNERGQTLRDKNQKIQVARIPVNEALLRQQSERIGRVHRPLSPNEIQQRAKLRLLYLDGLQRAKAIHKAPLKSGTIQRIHKPLSTLASTNKDCNGKPVSSKEKHFCGAECLVAAYVYKSAAKNGINLCQKDGKTVYGCGKLWCTPTSDGALGVNRDCKGNPAPATKKYVCNVLECLATAALIGAAANAQPEAINFCADVALDIYCNEKPMCRVADKPLQPQVFKKDWNYSKGDPSWFAAWFRGEFTLEGKRNEVSARVTGSAGAHIIGIPVEVLSLDAKYIGTNSTADSSLRLTVMGYDVINQPGGPEIEIEKTHSKTFEFGTGFTFWAGPVPLTVGVGLRGEVGFRYSAHLNPLHVNGEFTPFMSSSVYAQGEVGGTIDLWLCEVGAGGGVRATLTLLDDELTIAAHAGVTQQGVNATLTYGFEAVNQMTLMSGDVSVYAHINYCVGSKEVSWSIFSFEGLKIPPSVIFQGGGTI
jgi:hypothetical protein